MGCCLSQARGLGERGEGREKVITHVWGYDIPGKLTFLAVVPLPLKHPKASTFSAGLIIQRHSSVRAIAEPRTTRNRIRRFLRNSWSAGFQSAPFTVTHCFQPPSTLLPNLQPNPALGNPPEVSYIKPLLSFVPLLFCPSLSEIFVPTRRRSFSF